MKPHDPLIVGLLLRLDELDRQKCLLTQTEEIRSELQSRLLRIVKAMNEPDHLDTRRQALTLAATCLRMLRARGLETEEAAVAKDGDHS